MHILIVLYKCVVCLTELHKLAYPIVFVVNLCVHGHGSL